MTVVNAEGIWRYLLMLGPSASMCLCAWLGWLLVESRITERPGILQKSRRFSVATTVPAAFSRGER
jgi:hypothetical protein